MPKNEDGSEMPDLPEHECAGDKCWCKHFEGQ